MPGQLEFWFEYASTYSYLSAMRIEQACADAEVTLIWKPFLLGPIFAAQGWNDSPFNLNPAKGHYMWDDMAREAARLGLPFSKPAQFPQNGLLAARVSWAHADRPWIGAFVRRVYTANFANGRDISDPGTVLESLSGLAPDAEAALARAHDPSVKAALRDQTETARTSGIFGAPTFRVGGTLFWGNDRLAQALSAARGAG